MDFLRTAGRIALWTIALMSGLASVVREWIATFSPGTIQAPSLFDACLVTCFIASCGYAWLLERKRANGLAERLRPRLRISPDVFWQGGETGEGLRWTIVYLEIINESDATSIEGITVKLTRIEPEVSEMTWLSAPLHIKHDNPSPGQVYRTEFSLNPGENKHIDLAKAIPVMTCLEIEHVVSGVTKRIPNYDSYTLTVQATGRGVPPVERRFSIWMKELELQCTPLPAI